MSDASTEIEAIKQLKYRYLRCIDEKLWDELAGCFTPDATSSYSDGKYSFSGRDEIMEFLIGAMDRPSFLSSHCVHHPEIELTGPTTATGTWKLEDVVIDTQHEITIRGAAFYRDQYRKTEAGWQLSATGYRRTFEEMESRKDRPDLHLTANRWSPKG